MRANVPAGSQKIARYPWLGGGLARGQRAPALFALLAGGGLIYVYVTYLHSGDVSPDSFYGFAFAIAGTLLLLLVGVGYSLRKRLRRNWSGLLHTVLTWHIVGGSLALALILMHAAGNFNPRTGTYALYGLIALVVSGFIGKLLDRMAPRRAAQAALRTLTPDGEERLESLVSALDRKPRFRRERRRHVREPGNDGAPWDLAYYTLSPETGEIPALFNQPSAAGSASPHRASAMSAPYADSVVKGAMASESAAIREAIGAERFFLQLIRVWRYLHVAISVVTLGLILWHLEYAATLLIGAR